MHTLIALTVLAGKVKLRKNPSLWGKWDVTIQFAPFLGGKQISKVYLIGSEYAYENSHDDNLVYLYFKGLIDEKWFSGITSEYNFDENSEKEFDKIVENLKPKSLLRLMESVNVTENVSLDQALNCVKDCFVKDALES